MYKCRHYVGGFACVCTWVCHLRLCALRAIFACCRWASFCSRPSFRFDPTLLLPVAREHCALCHSRSVRAARNGIHSRSEEHTSELQSLMRISYVVFCLKKKIGHKTKITHRII